MSPPQNDGYSPVPDAPDKLIRLIPVMDYVNLDSAIMNRLAKAVRLDQVPGFVPVGPGDLFVPSVEEWIRLAEKYLKVDVKEKIG